MKLTSKRRQHRKVILVPITLVVTMIAVTIPTLSFAFTEAAAKSSLRQATASVQRDVRELKPGAPIGRELAGGETHSYRLIVTAGQYARVVVEQKGIDVVVKLFGPDEEKILEANSPNTTLGPEPVSLIATTSGNYRLDVVASEKTVLSGRYEIRIDKSGDATPQDRERLVAEKSFFDAYRLRQEGTAASLRQAIEKYTKVLDLWRALDDREQVAVTINQIGETLYELGDTQKSLDHFNEALLIWQKNGSRRGEAAALKNIGDAYSKLGNNETALRYLQQALPIWEEVGDQSERAITLNNIGLATNYLGKPDEALDYYHQALAIHRTLGDRLNEAATLNNLAGTYYRSGDEQKAFEYYSLALPLKRATKDLRGEAIILNNLGSMFWRLREYEKAVEYHTQTLSLARTTGDRNTEAIAIVNLGLDELSSGNKEKALEYYQQSLSLFRVVGNRRGEAYALSEIGKAYLLLRHYDKALDHYQQALAKLRNIGDRSGEGNTLSQIGVCYSELGNPQEALSHLEQALTLHRDLKELSLEALTLHKIANVELELGRYADARARIEAAIKIIESTRSKFISQTLRTSYSASVQAFYELYIELLMRMHKVQPSLGHDAVAFQVNEHARARGLLETLNEARIDIRQGVDVDLLGRERSLQDQLNIKSERLTRLLAGKHTEEQEKVARKDVDDLLTAYQDVDEKIRASSPRYAALKQPEPLNWKEIQQLLDGDTILLEYALGKDRSYLWRLTSSSVSSFELPKRSEIETLARQVYEALTARNRVIRFEKPADKQVRVAKADAEYFAKSTLLSRMVLGPVSGRLGNKRVVVVTDGALQYVPFGALPIPLRDNPRTSRETPGSYQPMIMQHEVVSLPSASTLALLRKEMVGRQLGAKTTAIFADPVFGEDDQRLDAMSSRATKQAHQQAAKLESKREFSGPMERSIRDTGGLGFPRLPYSRKEADAITALAPKGATRKWLDFEANRLTAISDDLSNYRIVHFATHGLLNSQHPELSGIVLSLVDKDGQSQDGFLRLHEIYNLKLGADLVVLSACRTALGKEIKGEGLVGVTRGFMYAGAPRVIASLWAIDDEITAEWMKRFYREMLVMDKRPAAAMRMAQVGLWREKHLPPYFWAAFVLQGEWR